MGISEVLLSVAGLGGLAVLIWAVRSVKRWGAAEYKQQQAEKDRDEALQVIERIEKAKGAVSRLTDDLRAKLRKRYNIK